MSFTIADIITHYSRGEPFRSITAVPEDQLISVLNCLDDNNTWAHVRFSHPDYLSQRIQVEEELRIRFIAAGGRPVTKNPIYFFLGRNLNFESHPKNIRYSISLDDIDPLTISFSYGDSMFCFHNQNRRQAGVEYRSELCDKLYFLDELTTLISNPSFPTLNPLHIEAQLWIEPWAAHSLSR